MYISFFVTSEFYDKYNTRVPFGSESIKKQYIHIMFAQIKNIKTGY